jgi:hypothetical protein
MNYLFLSIFLLMQLLPSSTLLKDNAKGWKLSKNEEGISVYTKDRKGSNFKEIKVSCTLHSSAASLVHLLSIKEEYPAWIYACSEARMLNQVSPFETYHYQVTDAPWPVEDRDLIVRTTVSQDPVTKVIDIYGVGIADYIPENKNKIRVSQYTAHWIITPKGNNTLDIVYLIALDPAGNLPPWIVNLGVSEGPLRTMKNLKARLPMYKDAKVSFIEEVE